MVGIIAPKASKEKAQAYERFIGLETVRDITAQDIGSKQPLFRLSNGYIDGVGQIIKDPGLDRIQSGFNVVNTKHFDLNDLTWIEQREGELRGRSSSGKEKVLGWSASSMVTSASFNSNLLFFAKDQIPWQYNGAGWFQMAANTPLAKLRPSFGCTVQSRFVVGGMSPFPSRIEISRVNDLNYFSDDEAEDSENVNRAGNIDIWSVIGKREQLTGLCAFETNKLVIFTSSRGIIYRVTTDLDGWQIEDRTSITTGCISHRTIAEAGQDVLYCSRTGVYTVSRSRDNGVAVTSAALSDNIKQLYRKLVKSVPDPRMISAVWDADENQYHIFFPQTIERSFRLTMTIDPTNPLQTARWALAEDTLLPTCGDFFEGSLVYGSAEGLYQVGKIEDDNREINPPLVVETPVLFLGQFDLSKTIPAVIVSAAGRSTMLLELIEHKTERIIWSRTVETEEASVPSAFYDAPLSDNRTIPVNVRTTAFRLRVTARGAGMFRFAGIAFTLGS